MNPKEKIRQFVIMARYPELSFEEGLNKESKKDYYCLASLDGKARTIIEWTMLKEIHNKISNKKFTSIEAVEVDTRKWIDDKLTILGRPITAMDVCWALQNNSKNETYTYYVNPKHIHICDPIEAYCQYIEFETIKLDGTHTTLDDWSDEVCEKIVKLIN